MTALRGRGLRKCYDNRLGLDLDALEVESGTALAVVGPNGSGKTTLLKLAALLLPRDSGHLELLGTVVGLRPRLDLRRRITYVGQSPFLFGGKVGAEVARGLAYRFAGREVRAAATQSALATVGLATLADRDTRSLSAGETLRVALARAIAIQPELLLLDEPTASLDAEAIKALEATLLAARGRTTVLFATHDRGFAASFAAQVLELDRGRRVASRMTH